SGKEEPVKIKIMANHEQANLSATDKKWVEQVQKDLNVELEFDIPPVTGYQERVQLMLASGDYPDLVYFPATNDQSFLNAVRDGLIVPVNDYIKNEESLMKYTYDVSWNALKVQQDEKIYGIPRTTVIRNDAFWVRKDWLKNIGFAIPDNSEITIDQFTEILTKFTKNDPDGNGKDDTYGYAAFADPNKVLQPILTSQFGELGWQKSEGGDFEYMDAMFDRSSDAYKNSLAYTAQLSKDGLLDPDSAVNNSTTSRERFIRGITGVMSGFAGHYGWHADELKKINPDADITYLFVKNEKDDKVEGVGYGVGLWGFWGLTKNAKNPQKVVDVLNYYLKDDVYPTMLIGYEGLDYTKQDGKMTAVEDKELAPVRLNTMRRAGDTEIYFSLTTPQDIIDMSTPWLNKSVESVVLSKNLDFTPEAAKKPDYMDYKKVWDQTIMKIVLGQTPVDEFDKLLAGWYDNGGEEYVKEMNEFIKSTDSGQ
ncbi:extracellular solute-binding protein, partial [Paenibacillus sepulcri]|nr:extracellular solute-binding protein [Paenibacillus sepulcri]